MLAIAASIGFTVISNNAVFAQGVPSTANPSAAFGQGSSQLGQSGTMGQHASDPLPDQPGREVPRTGIGNLGQPPQVACALDPTLSFCR